MRSLADEISFDIPDSWEWVRLGTVIELQSGQDMTPDKYNDRGKGIPYITGASNIENGNVLINRWTEYGRAFAYCGDILLTCKGTVGTMAVLQEPQVHIARQIMAIRPISELYVPYIQLVLDTLVENLKAAAKSMIPGIAREDVLQSLFPVPPVSEQMRIVQKVSVLSPCLEQYSAADTKLLSLNAAFPEALKKSILQEAVQGKLVPQDPSDEPAEALLERIRAEKQQLIKEGKIKKDTHESVIFRRDNSHYEKLDGVERCIDDELPFEIPESWVWVRVRDCTALFNGRAFKPSDWAATGLPIVRIQNLNDEKAPFNYFDKPVDEDVHLYGGELLFAWSGTPGTSFGAHIWRDEEAVLNQHIFKLLFDETAIFKPYYMYVLNQRVGSLIKAAHGSAGLQHVTRGVFEATLVPLPPLAEQHRIVQRIEKLLPLVKGL